jgi:hypothetical protein
MINIDDHKKTGVQGRTSVDRLVGYDTDAALKKARGIKHPWYRCQALTSVGAVLQSAKDACAVLEEALSAANELEEPNRIVTVSSWPIHVLVERNLRDVKRDVEHLLEVISSEPHSLRRSDALLSLFGATFPNKVNRHRVLGG